jgi:hypothetical protein
MGADEIRKHLRKQPFQPFRLFISDGATYDVRHPEMFYVSRSEVVIGLDADDAGLPEQSAYVAPMHVTRIEPIKGKPKRTTRRKRRS